MSRFTRALAAAAMAVAAAGGGLLIAAASAVPAWASAPAAPAAPHRGHTITVTAHPRAHAGHGIGPHDILPCAVKPGVKPASCGQQTISCSITAPAPVLVSGDIDSHATVTCSQQVTEIDLVDILIRSPGGNLQNQFPFTNTAGGTVGQASACQAGTYTNYGSALITFPEGYVLTAGSNPIHQTSAPVSFSTSACNPSGGGGGGGCAITSPSLARHLAGRHPDFVSCP